MRSAPPTPRQRIARLVAAPWLSAVFEAQAAAADGTPALGPWIFASVALVLVGGLGYLAGRRSGTGSTAPDRTVQSEHEAEDTRSKDVPAATEVLADTNGPGLQAASSPATESSAIKTDQDQRDHPTPPQPSAAEEVRAFSYTVSHDLRAPLRVVDGFARILKEDYGRQLDRIGNDHLDRVLGAAARMNAMIDAMLTLANLSSQPLSRQPIDLSQMALFIVEDLQRSAPQRTVQITIEQGLKATGDPTLMRQALENLLSNAWKYTGRCERPEISFRSLDIDGRPCFEVGDNGAGFDMRSVDRLFGLFQRLHSASDFPGTGVGLASVRRIIQRHGGDIWAESQPGLGSRFRFTLGTGGQPAA